MPTNPRLPCVLWQGEVEHDLYRVVQVSATCCNFERMAKDSMGEEQWRPVPASDREYVACAALSALCASLRDALEGHHAD